MIYFATVHYLSDMWIDIQLRQIAKHTNDPYQVWGCLNGIDVSHASKFDRVFDLEGKHGEKLNAMAEVIIAEAQPDDLIVFIDGDAFPIADWVRVVRAHLGHVPLVAVRRDENLGDPQPHPCFAVTTVGFWQEFEGDWEWGGKPWMNTAGTLRQDAGGRVLTKLEEQNIDWQPLLRSNKRDLHPVLFAVYGDLVYHHGAGFRNVGTTVDKHLVGALRWKIGGEAWKRGIRSFVSRKRLEKRMRINQRMSAEIFDQISRDDDYVRRFFIDADQPAPVSR